MQGSGPLAQLRTVWKGRPGSDAPSVPWAVLLRSLLWETPVRARFPPTQPIPTLPVLGTFPTNSTDRPEDVSVCVPSSCHHKDYKLESSCLSTLERMPVAVCTVRYSTAMNKNKASVHAVTCARRGRGLTGAHSTRLPLDQALASGCRV